MSARWSLVYKRAVNKDGSLFFPERLSEEFLAEARRTMGSYLFSNQYENRIIPDEMKVFKKEWLRYYQEVPSNTNTFVFIDPAISQANTADYTALVVIKVDAEQNWYVVVANRYKINPTQLIQMVFKTYDEYHPTAIGIEDVAFQKALVHFIGEEMKSRNKYIPVTGVNPGIDKSKEMRILGLVPRFEYSKMFLNRGLVDLETEILQFPRAQHDDLLDALSSVEKIVHYPTKERKVLNEPASPNHPDYERWFIQQRIKQSNQPDEDFG